MISSNLHLKSSAKNGSSNNIGFSFKERFLRLPLLIQDFYHFHHVIWGMKWAKKLKIKNGQNMSSGPFSHDSAHIIMQMQYTKSLNPGRFKLGTTFSYLIRSKLFFGLHLITSGVKNFVVDFHIWSTSSSSVFAWIQKKQSNIL